MEPSSGHGEAVSVVVVFVAFNHRLNFSNFVMQFLNSVAVF